MSIPDVLTPHVNRLTASHLTDLFDDDPQRTDDMAITVGDIHVDFSKNHLDQQAIGALIDLAEQKGIPDKITKLLSGGVVNITENRAAFHAGLRMEDPPEKVSRVDDRIKTLVDGVRSGRITGHTGKPIDHVINVGIGGSDLGPKSALRALKGYHDGPEVHFLSTVDGARLNRILDKCNPERTLVLVASKSFSTIETLTNANALRSWIVSHIGDGAIGDHFIGLTANDGRAIDFGILEYRIFSFPDWVGGRFSVWSSPIGLSLALAIGWDNFMDFRAGGRSMDDHLANAPLDKNLPFLLGALDYWYHSVIGLSARAIIPYATDLAMFVDHIQQVSMESLGKSVTESGHDLGHDSGPVIFGQLGTDAQHAFVQLLHQGTHIVPVDFIAVKHPLSDQHPHHHQILNANAVAQAGALMVGRHIDDGPTDNAKNARHRVCDGNRPSNMIMIDQINPSTLGQLYALYEHRIILHGFFAGINPFDQFGVELGKKLARNIIADGMDDPDPSTRDLIKRLELSKP